MTYFKTKPYVLQHREGRTLHSLETIVLVKATTEQTNGAFNLFEIVCPQSYTTPLHIHYAEDVAVYVLEGALTLFWGSEKKAAVAGSYFYQPRGTPHGFRVEGDAPARILYLTIPAGLDRLGMEDGQPTSNSESVTVAARYQIEVLGPLPE